jgi:hypothetical protein
MKPKKQESVALEQPRQGVKYICKDNEKKNNKKNTHENSYSLLGYGKPLPKAKVEKAYINLPISLLSSLYRARAREGAIAVAALLHRQADMRGWPVVRLPTALFNLCGLNRWAVSRALAWLEREGFIRVHRKPGKRSTATVLWHPVRDLCFVVGDDDSDDGDDLTATDGHL